MVQKDYTQALLIALGPRPGQAVLSINHYAPEHLIFFAGEEAQRAIDRSIQPGIRQMPKRWECLVTPDHHHLSKCYQSLSGKLGELLRHWQIEPGALVVDYTQATPAMAIALTLAATEYSGRFVQMLEQTPAGPDATPAVMEANPWDQRAPVEAHLAAIHFNQGRYVYARLAFSRLQEGVSGGLKPLYKGLSDLCHGYALWHAFEYPRAVEKLKGARKSLDLSAVWGGPPGMKPFLAAVGENLGFLEKIMMAQGRPDRNIFLDLLANARRCAEFTHHYEDAMVRLLRSLEALAQSRLEKAFGIKTGDARAEQLPAGWRDDYTRCFTSELDGRIKLNLYQEYALLKEKGDPLGESFFSLWPQLKLSLDTQYGAILGHGFDTVRPERYHQLFDQILKLSETRPEQLPRFPVMPF